MAKSRKPKQRKRKDKATANATAAPDRRRTLIWLRNGVIGAAVLGGGGYLAAGSFRAYAAEHDLSRLGQGKPAIVQIHDPQCPTCTALQKQARRALKPFATCDLVYLVADISTPEGAAFAARYGVPHVTLLLFDGAGTLQDTQHGLQNSAELGAVFRRHHSLYGVDA